MADRRIGLAMDFSKTSVYALKWALQNIVRDGDTLVLLVVVRKTDQEESVEHLWGSRGSPMIPIEELKPPVLQHYGIKQVDEEFFAVLDKIPSGKLTIQGKIYYGDPKEKIVDAIVQLPLDSLIMGSRGLGGLKKVFLGSVSDAVVNNAPCPVTVVKLPESSIS